MSDEWAFTTFASVLAICCTLAIHSCNWTGNKSLEACVARGMEYSSALTFRCLSPDAKDQIHDNSGR